MRTTIIPRLRPLHLVWGLVALTLAFVFALAPPIAAQGLDPGSVDAGSSIGISITWATLIVAITKAVSLVKTVLAKDWNAVLTLAVAIAVGIGLVLLVAHSDFHSFTVPGMDLPLSDAKTGTVVLIGIVLGLASAYGRDVLKAIDGTTSTAEPPIKP